MLIAYYSCALKNKLIKESYYFLSIDQTQNTNPPQKIHILPTQPRHFVIQIQLNQCIKLFTKAYFID